MAHHNGHTIEVSDPGTLEGATGGLANKARLAGVVGLVAAGLLAAITGDWSRFLFSYLHNIVFICCLASGALAFVLIQHVTRAGWSAVVRRFAELVTTLFIPAAVLFLPIALLLLLGNDTLYWWNDRERAATDALVAHKMIYLHPVWFTLRAVLFFGFWICCSVWYLKTSARQDESGDKQLTLNMSWYSPLSLFAFGWVLSFAGIDWVMSLDPHWFSTIYGVYLFANSMVIFMATLALIVYFANKNGILAKEITAEHRHDIGKLMFGFNCFWAYIAFSQYLLYWYANIPEETIWFKHRQENGWEYVSLFLIIGHFAIPFMGLMSRHVKRNAKLLPMWAAYMLVVCWIDLYWLIMPEQSRTSALPSLIDLACLVGVVGFCAYGALKYAGGYNLLAKKDPRLPESLHFHNI